MPCSVISVSLPSQEEEVFADLWWILDCAFYVVDILYNRVRSDRLSLYQLTLASVKTTDLSGLFELPVTIVSTVICALVV